MLLAIGYTIAAFIVHNAHLLANLLFQKWAWLLFILLLRQCSRSLKAYVLCRPEKAIISGLPTFIGQWITSLSYHMVSMNIVREEYLKVWSTPRQVLLHLL